MYRTLFWSEKFLSHVHKNCAEILQPLNDLMKGYKKSFRNKIISWEQNDEALKAFSKANGNLADAAALHYPTRNDII